MIASHSLIDNQSLHAMDTYIHGSRHGSARHGSALSAVPRRLAWTLLTAVALFTMLSLYTYTLPIFFVIMLLSSSSYYTLYFLSTTSTAIVLSIHHLSLSMSFAMPTLSSMFYRQLLQVLYYYTHHLLCPYCCYLILSYTLLYSPPSSHFSISLSLLSSHSVNTPSCYLHI